MTVALLPLAIIAGLLRTQAQALLYRLSTRRRRTALRYAPHGSPADPIAWHAHLLMPLRRALLA